MYNFIDTTETPEGLSLPSEALMLNGVYIENLISGYRTLTVEGREALSPEISAFDTGIRDGSTMQGKRYPARVIRITYQLIAASAEAFREAYNKLASILNVTDAQLIFNDEQDKFYTGTPSFIGEVEPGKNAVVGEFEITCLDPFKYSVTEYEVVPGVGETDIVIDYNGTYKGFPTLRAEFFNEDEASEDGETVTALSGKGDCGYVAFFNEDEKIIQLGDPDEVDIESGGAKSQTLVNHAFSLPSKWGTATRSLWSMNNGKSISGDVSQTGIVGQAVSSYITKGNSTEVKKTPYMRTLNAAAEKPYVNYVIWATATDRKESSVKVTVYVDSSLATDSNYFGQPYELQANITVGDQTKTVTLKSKDTRWEGKTKHTTSATFTVSVQRETTSITGVYFETTRPDGNGKTGIIGKTKCNDIQIPAYIAPQIDSFYLKCLDYGSGNKWHGASITRTIPADALGEVGAKNFRLSYTPQMSIGATPIETGQHGAFMALAVSGTGANRKVVAGVFVRKGSAGKNGNIDFYVNGTKKETVSIDLSYNNKYFDARKESSITKSENKVTFDIGGIKKVYTDDTITDSVTTEITLAFLKYGNKPELYYNGIKTVSFTKDNCATWRDIPNKFRANDVVEADCNTGKISLNGVASPALGALGNDWEGFCLTPGINQIGFSYSEWVESQYAPTFRVRYREVFL
jgi:predicted phage tail component-like protein